eukprot:3130732-Amphidinium_carterae.1
MWHFQWKVTVSSVDLYSAWNNAIDARTVVTIKVELAEVGIDAWVPHDLLGLKAGAGTVLGLVGRNAFVLFVHNSGVHYTQSIYRQNVSSLVLAPFMVSQYTQL